MEEFCRALDITDLSAEDLRDVRLILKMKIYAIVAVAGDPFIDPNRWYTTNVDRTGRTCPKWNNTLFNFTLHDPSLQTNRLQLLFRFYCRRTFHHDRYVGGVTIPVKRLFNLTGELDSFFHVSFPVKLPSGGVEGALSFSFQFGKSIPRLMPPAPPWPPLHLPRSSTFNQEHHHTVHHHDPYQYRHGSLEACNYDHHQHKDDTTRQPPYSTYNFRSFRVPSAPTYDQVFSNMSGSCPDSSEHCPGSDHDQEDAYYSSASYDDDVDHGLEEETDL